MSGPVLSRIERPSAGGLVEFLDNRPGENLWGVNIVDSRTGATCSSAWLVERRVGGRRVVDLRLDFAPGEGGGS